MKPKYDLEIVILALFTVAIFVTVIALGVLWPK